jgi:hypothetical protein
VNPRGKLQANIKALETTLLPRAGGGGLSRHLEEKREKGEKKNEKNIKKEQRQNKREKKLKG